MQSFLLNQVLGVTCILFLSGVWANPDLDLVLYGATGCVGGFAAKHLAKQPSLRWAVAGRNASEIQALAAVLCADPETVSCPKQIVAPLDEKHDPESWLKRTRAVATAAGPFSKHGGEYLLKAAARLGVHYTDTSDEFYWQREMVDRHDETARKSGARIVFSSGFCALAGDLGSQLALAKVSNSGDTRNVDAWLETYNGGISAGVLNTFKAMKNASFPKEWESDPYVLTPDANESLKVDSSVTGLGKIGYDWHEGTVTQNIFGPYDARLIRRSFVTRGQAVHFRAGAPPSMYTKWSAFLALHPGAWSSLTKCPTPAIFNGGSWRMRLRAFAGTGKQQESHEVLLSGSGDPGYRFTSVGLAEAGLCLAGKIEGCMRSGSEGGVLTAMGALEPQKMKERLESIGLLAVQEKSMSKSSATAVHV